MATKVFGVVFRSIRYGESAVVLHVFTDLMGLQSYLVRGARKPKTKISPNVLQPLHWVEIMAFHKTSGELHLVKEIRNVPAYHDIPVNLRKTTLVLFLNEVLVKAVRYHQKDVVLFEFLQSSLFWLEGSFMPLANFHLLFLLQLSRYLGFYPSVTSVPVLDGRPPVDALYFDSRNGNFIPLAPSHPGYLGQSASMHLYHLCCLNFEQGSQYPITREDRATVLEAILEYYAYHLDGFAVMKSLPVLNEIFE